METEFPTEFQAALGRAASLLALRARSRRELGDRLITAGYGPVVVEQVGVYLSDLGLVDDREFALERVRHLLESGRSAAAIRGDLKSGRLADEVVDSAFEELDVEGGEEARAVAIARRRALACAGLPVDKAFARVARYLGARGYEPEVVEEACRKVFGTRGND